SVRLLVGVRAYGGLSSVGDPFPARFCCHYAGNLRLFFFVAFFFAMAVDPFKTPSGAYELL
ncbi:MAG: hypothetical protein AAF911_15145, partial [Planctomycetota bacterium]